MLGRKNNDPLVRMGMGFRHVVTLVAAGTLAAHATNVLDAYRVPLDAAVNRKGFAEVFWEVTAQLSGLGGSSGGTTWKLIKNGDATNGIIVSDTIAYNAAANYARTMIAPVGTQPPIIAYLKPGDLVSLIITAIPGSASTNLKVHVSASNLGMNGV